MKKNEIQPIDGKLLSDIRQIIDTARANAVRSVDFSRVTMYWNLGNGFSRKNNKARIGRTMVRESSDVWQNVLSLNMEAVLESGSWSKAANSTGFIQLRTHCMRN